ncbi:hypothetical protein SAMN05444162_1921 [Paenibacillaceae bacterium GAS479]|nr:hypothetical protein SAMN05444162_1921 [Paenibacillaceae bacterium GAS479]
MTSDLSFLTCKSPLPLPEGVRLRGYRFTMKRKIISALTMQEVLPLEAVSCRCLTYAATFPRGAPNCFNVHATTLPSGATRYFTDHDGAPGYININAHTDSRATRYLIDHATPNRCKSCQPYPYQPPPHRRTDNSAVSLAAALLSQPLREACCFRAARYKRRSFRDGVSHSQ